MSTGFRSANEGLDVAQRLPEGPLAAVLPVLVGSVLDLDHDGAAVADIRERGEERSPVDVAEPRQLRIVPSEPEDAVLVPTNVVTRPTSRRADASITARRWFAYTSRSAGSATSGFG